MDPNLPIKESWKQYSSGAGNHGVSRPNPTRTVATRIATHDEAMLIAAAPDMARAILAALNGEKGWQKELEAAARKAGLPVPE